VDAVGIQTVFLILVVITAIVLVAEEVVLKTVHVCYVCPSSWFEAVELVAHVWRRMK